MLPEDGSPTIPIPPPKLNLPVLFVFVEGGLPALQE